MKNHEKGESLLIRNGVIKKVGVYCYKKLTTKYAGEIKTEEVENLIIIGNNREQLEEKIEGYDHEDMGDHLLCTEFTLVHSADLHIEEVIERFDISKEAAEEIFNGENFKMGYWDLSGKDYFNECKLSMKEIIEKRKIDEEPFDSDEIISKIAKEYDITSKRKSELLKSIEKLESKYFFL